MKNSRYLIIGALALTSCAKSQGVPAQAATPAQPQQAKAMETPVEQVSGAEESVAAPATQTQPKPAANKPKMGDMCPVLAAGTSVKTEDVEGKAVLSFTTTGDVNQLQRQVASLAERHRTRQARAYGGRGQMMPQAGPTTTSGSEQQPSAAAAPAGERSQRPRMGMLPEAEVKVENTATGANLIYTPKDPKNLGQLRAKVQQRGERMQSGQCTMGKSKKQHNSPR